MDLPEKVLEKARQMKCREVVPLLSDHLDGFLSGSRHRSVVVHLLWCTPCRREMKVLRRIVMLGQLAALRASETDASAIRSVLNKLRRDVEE